QGKRLRALGPPGPPLKDLALPLGEHQLRLEPSPSCHRRLPSSRTNDENTNGGIIPANLRLRTLVTAQPLFGADGRVFVRGGKARVDNRTSVRYAVSTSSPRDRKPRSG